MKILKVADIKKEPVNAENLAAMVDSLRIYLHGCRQGVHASVDSHVLQRIEQLPSRFQILRNMEATDLRVTRETVEELWKVISGKEMPSTDTVPAPETAKDLDGNFWMIPGGMFLKGINHYAAAKSHKNLICSILNINPWIFEKKMAGDPQEFIRFLILNGAIRVNINRMGSKVVCQCNKESWTTVADKLRRMYHKNKISRVIDPSRPYRGWKSGIPLVIH